MYKYLLSKHYGILSYWKQIKKCVVIQWIRAVAFSTGRRWIFQTIVIDRPGPKTILPPSLPPVPDRIKPNFALQFSISNQGSCRPPKICRPGRTINELIEIEKEWRHKSRSSGNGSYGVKYPLDGVLLNSGSTLAFGLDVWCNFDISHYKY